MLSLMATESVLVRCEIVDTNCLVASKYLFSTGYAKITPALEAECCSKQSTITASGLAFHRAKLFGFSLKQEIDVAVDQEVCPNPQQQDIAFSEIPYIAIDVRIPNSLVILIDMFTRETIFIYGCRDTSPIVIYV